MKRFSFIGTKFLATQKNCASFSEILEPAEEKFQQRFQFKIEHTLYILISMSRLRDPMKPETVYRRILFFQSIVLDAQTLWLEMKIKTSRK